MAAQTESTTLLSPFPDIFSDLRVRYGIKLSLASLLSLYLALVLRLEHPNWAVLTALVMMNSHYVGSTVVKAMLRCVGTIVGAWETTLFAKNLFNNQKVIQHPNVEFVNEGYRLRPLTVGLSLSGSL